MKKQILFILTGLMLAVGAGAVIYETTGTDLQVWIQNTIVYSAKVSDIDSISTQETANAKKIRMWVNQAMAYEADVRGIDSITFAESVELIEPDTIPADTIPAAELSMQVWINNAIVYTARVSDIDSISAQQTADAKNIRVWVNQAVAYEADVRGIDSITFAKYIEPVIPDTIPTDTIPVIPPDTIPTDTIPTDTIPVIPPDTIPTDTIPVIPPDTIPTDTIPVIPPDTIPAIDCPEGAIPGLFSVAADKRVYFSRGNLQYVDSIWQFAEHQWDYFGSNQSDDHRDLFGWGTGFEPNKVSTTSSDYDIFVDWGANPITNGGNKDHIWQTLTQAENKYLLFTRENADILFALGTVNGVKGLILLPDDWELPEGATFNPSTTMGMVSEDNKYTNSKSTSFTHNTYTTEQWAVMESAGAVFLPAAGYRNGKTSTSSVGSTGYYWTPTTYTSQPSYANYLSFDSKSVNTASTYSRSYGRSVRLVQPETLPVDTIPADTIPAEEPEVVKGFTCNANGEQLVFAKGNLQYQGNTNTWRFAEHQWDTCGFDNAYMSPVTRKWVDLFGFMRADLPALSKAGDANYADSVNYSWAKCPIVNGEGYRWFPPGTSALDYIIDKRTNHAQLFSGATVNGIGGLIILPDEWVLPEGLSFVSAEEAGLQDKGSRYTGVSNIYAINTYSAEQWELMEAAGAVFLPAAGYRHEYTVSYVQTEGNYWTSATLAGNQTHAYSMQFSNNSVILNYNVPRPGGLSVRMIRYLNDTIRHNPTTPEPKPATVTFTANEDSTQLLFAPGNLQYIDGKYYFAQHQYDTLGTTNRTAGLVTTDGYVGSYAMDLFGWGTATNPLLMSSESGDYQTFTNWGTMPIMNTTETWRTPGMSELRYILRRRNYADKLFAGATVNGIAGLIILPDHFVVPEGIDFHSSTDPDMGYVKYDDHYKSTGKSLYTHNTYTLAEWAQMEAAGAVFLPAAGFRGGSGDNVQLHYVNEEGYYWTNAIRVNTSGAAINPAVAYDLKFSPSIVGPEEEHFRDNGRSVRLVRTVAP